MMMISKLQEEMRETISKDTTTLQDRMKQDIYTKDEVMIEVRQT